MTVKSVSLGRPGKAKGRQLREERATSSDGLRLRQLRWQQKVAGGTMVWVGGPRSGGRAKPIVLHDPPPGYRPREPRIPLKEQQRAARQDWILMRVATVVLVLAAAAFMAIMLVIIATHI